MLQQSIFTKIKGAAYENSKNTTQCLSKPHILSSNSVFCSRRCKQKVFSQAFIRL